MSRKLNTLNRKNPILTRISVESENEEKIQLLLYGDIGQYYSWSGISLDGVVSALAGKSGGYDRSIHQFIWGRHVRIDRN